MTPGFWMHETSGKLAPVVTKYIQRKPLDDAEIVVMRAYLRQWIGADAWLESPGIKNLRLMVDKIVDMPTLDAWLDIAFEEGVDPL